MDYCEKLHCFKRASCVDSLFCAEHAEEQYEQSYYWPLKQGSFGQRLPNALCNLIAGFSDRQARAYSRTLDMFEAFLNNPGEVVGLTAANKLLLWRETDLKYREVMSLFGLNVYGLAAMPQSEYFLSRENDNLKIRHMEGGKEAWSGTIDCQHLHCLGYWFAQTPCSFPRNLVASLFTWPRAQGVYIFDPRDSGGKPISVIHGAYEQVSHLKNDQLVTCVPDSRKIKVWDCRQTREPVQTLQRTFLRHDQMATMTTMAGAVYGLPACGGLGLWDPIRDKVWSSPPCPGTEGLSLALSPLDSDERVLTYDTMSKIWLWHLDKKKDRLVACAVKSASKLPKVGTFPHGFNTRALSLRHRNTSQAAIVGTDRLILVD